MNTVGSPSRLALLGGTPSVPDRWKGDWPILGEEETEAVQRQMQSRILSIYDRSGIIAEFEDAFAEYHAIDGTRPHALSHNAGTSALHAAYFGVGVGPGDEVIVPTYTFLATVMPLLQCGGVPIFADMDAETLAIALDDVESRITPRTVAVVVTHMWGHPGDMDRLVAICKKHSLALIEDCSHAHGSTYRGQRVGTFGDVGCFSLEGHKAMIAGEGGVMITRDRRIYERALLLGHFGRRIRDEIELPEHKPFVMTGLGHKYRMHPLGAAIALQQLKHLDKHNEMRRQNLDYLSQLLHAVPGIKPPVTLPHVTRGGFYGYKPRFVPEELPEVSMERYVEALQAEGVQVKLPGSKPMHLLPTFQVTRSHAESMKLPWAFPWKETTSKTIEPRPVAEAVFNRLLSLPTFTLPATERIYQYGEAFRKVASHRAELIDYSAKEN